MSRIAKKIKRSIRLGSTFTIVLVVAGCASLPTNGLATAGQPGRSVQSGCNSVESGVVGALIGGLIGAATHGKRGAMIGAVTGAAVGSLGCALYNARYRSQQIASARTVDRNYTRSHGGQLPTQTVVTSYTSALQPNDNVVAGHKANLESQLTVVRGRAAALPEVKEQVILLSPDGRQLTKFVKPATAVNGSGEYRTNFSFTLPKGVERGRYIIHTTVIVNGEPVRSNTVAMVVVA